MNMKREWNERAEKNAYHYVLTHREKWDDESFFKWGEIQTRAVIDKFLKDKAFDPANKTMLEIGCGAGRMTCHLASRFESVYAYDVSDRYIQIAREKNGQLDNVFFHVNDGKSFPEIKDKSIDFVFSGWTFMHMPTKDIAIENIKEIGRVLKKSGLYKIDPAISKLARFREVAILRQVWGMVSSLRVKDKLKLTPTFRGVTFTEKELSMILTNFGLTVKTLIENDASEYCDGNRRMKKWLYGKKI